MSDPIRLAVALCALALVAASAHPQPPRTVERVDLDRYVGLWYEIAKIPNRFQDQCAYGTTAEYELREDGEITVRNACFQADGELDEAKGIARVVDEDSQARLEVSFVSFLGWRPFWGDYWILGLDEEYRWAAIGSPDRKYGWILAREHSLAPSVLDSVFELLEAQGFDRSDFELSPQEALQKSR